MNARFGKVLWVIFAGLLLGACKGKEEAPPPEVKPVPVKQEAPKAKVVMASADPQHGGFVKRMGDYMVELKAQTDGNMDVYVQKIEGATSAVDNVQVEVSVTPKSETPQVGSAQAEPASADPAGAKPVEVKTAEAHPAETQMAEPVEEKNVVFYPEEGRLKGRVAGIPMGKYLVKVALFDDQNNMSEATFDDVELQPAEGSIETKHDGEVYVVEDKKLEVVRSGDQVEIYVSDLKTDQPIPSDQAQVTEVKVQTGQDKVQTITIQPLDGRYIGKMAFPLAEDEAIKLIDVNMSLAGKVFRKMRMAKVPKRIEGIYKKDKVIPTERPEVTTSSAKREGGSPIMKPTIAKPMGKIAAPAPKDPPKSPRATRNAEKAGGQEKKAEEAAPKRKTREAKKAQ